MIELKGLKRLPTKKPILVDPLGYSKNERIIINKWEECGGKIPKRTGTTVLLQAKISIDTLLSNATNEYTVIDNDPEFADKIWTVKEICDCIDFYTNKLRKPINYQFPNFVVFRNFSHSKSARTRPDYSPLIETFLDLPKDQRSNNSDYLRDHIVPFTKGKVHERIYIRASAFIDSLKEQWEINECRYNLTFEGLLIDYVKDKLMQNSEWKVAYIAGIAFLEEWRDICIKGHCILPKGTNTRRRNNSDESFKRRMISEKLKNQEEFCDSDLIK